MKATWEGWYCDVKVPGVKTARNLSDISCMWTDLLDLFCMEGSGMERRTSVGMRGARTFGIIQDVMIVSHVVD